MTKFALLSAAALTAIAGAGISLPATAAPLVTQCDANSSTYVANNSQTILMQLKQKGVDASSVDQWNGCVQAFVTKTNGTQTIEFFKPYSLQKIEA